MNNLFDLTLILIMVCYAFLNGIGAYFLKSGLGKVKDLEMSLRGFFKNPFHGIYQLLKIPTWVLGGVFFVSGFLIYQYALSLYDLSVVKPLTNLSIVVIFFLGLKFLKERITKRELFGISAMVTGIILVSMFVSEKSTELNILNMILFSLILIIICILFIIFTLMKRNKKIDEYFLTLVSGILFSLGILYNNAIYVVYGEFTLSLEFLISLFFISYFYFLIISYLFAFFIGQIAYSSGRMIIIAPIVNILSLGIPVLGAFLIFNEEFTILKLIGIIFILIGILSVYPRMKQKEKAELVPIQ